MTGKRTRYSADFKAKVALEALRGELTTAQLAAKHGIHQTMVGDWKRQAMEGLAAVFSGKSAAEERAKATDADVEKLRDGIRVSRKRLLRVMRENALLSPHRARRKDEDSHQRQIITTAPNVMWAIDATQVTTVQDGKVWLFGAVEHWNAELLGWHVTKRGTRFEATQALSMAVRQQFGHLFAGAARGLALRHDHGSNFMAEHFQKQARFWGISPSFAFVGEPETNGVIERLFRTLKEQIVHGRVFQTIDEVRDAVRDFVARYNAEWLIEKNGFRSPNDARNAWLDTNLRRAA